MKLVIFGLTVSSSWGNGHATLWRGLWRALSDNGHQVVFFERDVPYYRAHRDLTEMPGGSLVFYQNWEEVFPRAQTELADAEVAMVTSYCPDGPAACEAVLGSGAARKVFYDLDTPVTLDAWKSGQIPPYLPPDGLGRFDLVLSYTGGRALTELRRLLGARVVAPLYGHVDPRSHHPVAPVDGYRNDFSYLGTYAADRQPALEALFIEPARQRPQRKFLIGGAQYPAEFPWTENIHFAWHVTPAEHPAFFCSSRLTLNITRAAMAAMGFCPSGRLFEAAACGVPMMSDDWDGLDQFFAPGDELLVARTTEQALNALEVSDAELDRIRRAARERVLAQHTAAHRAGELERLLTALPASPPLAPATAEA